MSKKFHWNGVGDFLLLKEEGWDRSTMILGKLWILGWHH